MMVRIGVISVGGRGTRLGRNEIQKCLMPIAGKPILEYIIDALRQTGARTIFLLTGFLSEQIHAYLATRKRIQDCEIRPIWGGIEGQIAALLKLKPMISQNFAYSHGDCIFPVNIVQRLIDVAARHPESIAVMSATSNVKFVESHPRVKLVAGTEIIESICAPNSSEATPLAGTGVYYFKPAAFTFLQYANYHPLLPTSEFVRYAQASGFSVAASVTDDPIFCLHPPADLIAWQDSDMCRRLGKEKR